MTAKEAIKNIKDLLEGCCGPELDDTREALDMATSALQAQDLQPTCNELANDTISRQAAIDALEKVATLFPWKVPGNRDSYDRYNEAWNDAIGRAEIEIEELPSVQPEIIHCRDCKKCQVDSVYHDYWCDGRKVWRDHYCGFAERRTDG